MKSELSNGGPSEWVKKASHLHKAIKSARLNMKTEFPQNEHLQPQDAVRKELKPRLLLFLNFDVAQLVNKSDLEVLLIEAKELGISKGNILHSELIKSYTKAKELRTKINQFTLSSSKNYAEAKQLFSDLLESGVWIEEAEIIRRIIQVNRNIETLLSLNDHECYHGLKEIKEIEGKFIDPAFKIIIASRFQECQTIKRKLDHLFQKETLEFDDFELIDKLVKDCRNLQHFIPNHDKLLSLYKSFVWMLELAYQYKLKTKYLGQLVFLLLERIRIDKHRGNLKEAKETLKEVSTITYTQLPIRMLVQQCQHLMWDEEARDYLVKPLFRKEEIRVMLERAPTETFTDKGETAEYTSLKAMYEKMKTWESQVEIICRQTTELRLCEAETFSRRMNSSLNQIEEAIVKAHEDYRGWLNKIEEFQKLKTQLDFSEKVLIMSKCVFRINNKKKIEHMDYQKAKELFKEGKSHKFMDDNLFVAFRKLLKLLNRDVKLLKEVYVKINSKESHATPDLFEPKFIVYAKDLNKAESALKAITQVEDYIYLGDFGVIIKNFIADFNAAESSLWTLTQEYPSADLPSFGYEKIKEIIDDFSSRKQKWRVRLYSAYLGQLARYEWLLNSLYTLKSSQCQYEMIERLTNCSEVAMQDDREVVKSLQEKLKIGKELIDKVDELFSSPLGLTIDSLKEIKLEMDSATVISKIQKKQIDNEYRSYELIEHDFQQARIPSPEGSINTIEELKILLTDACSLKYKSSQIEKALMETIHASELLLKSINQNKPVVEILASIERYQKVEILVKEVEVVLRNRQIALDYLNQDNLNIDRMSQQELKLLEKCISNSLDLTYKEKLGPKILRRKYNLISSIEKKSQEAGDENKIKLTELISILDQMKEAKKSFNNDEIDYVQEKISQTHMYLEQLKKVKEETLKRCSKVLFYYLDVSEHVKNIQKNFQPTPSILDKLLNQDEAEERIVTEASKAAENILAQELLEKSDRKQLRRELIKELRKTILRFNPVLTKLDGTDYAKAIENSIYQVNKSDILSHRNRVSDYKSLIEKCHEKQFIIELTTTKPISMRLLDHLLNDESAEFKGLRDMIQARRYLRILELKFIQPESTTENMDSLQGSGMKYRGDHDASLGKRALLRPFHEEDLELLQVAQKRTKDTSAKKQPAMVIHDNINLDTPETKKGFGFPGNIHEVVDMEEVDDDSQPFSNSSLNNSTSKDDDELADSRPQTSRHHAQAVDSRHGCLMAEVSARVTAAGPSQMLQEVSGDGVACVRHARDDSRVDSEVMKAEVGEDEDVKSYMEFELIGKSDYTEMDEEKIEHMAQGANGNKGGIKNELMMDELKIGNDRDKFMSQGPDLQEVFNGTLMFESLQKAVSYLKLIAVGTYKFCSKIPAFKDSAISFQKELSLSSFEKDLVAIKRDSSDQRCQLFSGFIIGGHQMMKTLRDTLQGKNSVYFCTLSEWTKMYLLSTSQANLMMRSMRSEYERDYLEQNDFTFLLVVDYKAKIDQYANPVEFNNTDFLSQNGNSHTLVHKQPQHKDTKPQDDRNRATDVSHNISDDPIKARPARVKY